MTYSSSRHCLLFYQFFQNLGEIIPDISVILEACECLGSFYIPENFQAQLSLEPMLGQEVILKSDNYTRFFL